MWIARNAVRLSVGFYFEQRYDYKFQVRVWSSDVCTCDLRVRVWVGVSVRVRARYRVRLRVRGRVRVWVGVRVRVRVRVRDIVRARGRVRVRVWVGVRLLIRTRDRARVWVIAVSSGRFRASVYTTFVLPTGPSFETSMCATSRPCDVRHP